MDAAKIGAFNAFDGIDDTYSKPGQILGVYALVTGTNAVGQVGTAADVGRFLHTRDDDQFQNTDFGEYQKIMNTRSGISVLNSVDGGAFEAVCFMPYFEEGFANCLNITNKNELNIGYQPAGSVQTVFTALNVELWIRTAAYAETYTYRIGLKNAIYPAAEKSDPVQLGQEDLTTVYIDDQDNVLDLFQLEVDNRTIQGSASELLLRAITLQENQVEDTSFDFIKIPVFTPGKIGTTQNRSGLATISVTGAGTVRLILCSMSRNGRGR